MTPHDSAVTMPNPADPSTWLKWLDGLPTTCEECGPDADLCPYCGRRGGVVVDRDMLGPGDEGWKCRACADEWNTRHPRPVPWPPASAH